MEFVGSLPVLALGALVCVQALLVAISLLFAHVVAERSAAGAQTSAALSAIPAPWRSRVTISSDAERVRVAVQPPAVVPGMGSRLRVTARTEQST